MVFPTFIAGAKIRKKSEHHKKVEKISLKTSQRSTTRLAVRIFYKYLFDSFLWVLGWDKVVSGTWARHSFATNLKLAGVEELYISESMGHSQGNDVTSGYQDMYPLEIRFRNNCKLLNIEKEEEPIDIDSFTSVQMKEMLKKMRGSNKNRNIL